MIYLVIYLWVVGGVMAVKSNINPLQQDALTVFVGWPIIYIFVLIKRGN